MKMTRKELKQMLKLALVEIERLQEELSVTVADCIEQQWLINRFEEEAEKKMKKK